MPEVTRFGRRIVYLCELPFLPVDIRAYDHDPTADFPVAQVPANWVNVIENAGKFVQPNFVPLVSVIFVKGARV